MAKATAAPEAKPSITRDPLAIGSGILTIVGTIMYVLPSMGIKLPPVVTKFAGLAFTIAAALGMKSAVKPA
jgi:hypothetical protein